MKVVYFADDGKPFDTEDACLEYEQPLDEYKVDEIRSLWMNASGTCVPSFIFRHFEKISKIMRSF